MIADVRPTAAAFASESEKELRSWVAYAPASRIIYLRIGFSTLSHSFALYPSPLPSPKVILQPCGANEGTG